MFETIKADFNRYYDLLPSHYGTWHRVVFYISCHGMWAIVDFRFRKWLKSQDPIIRWILWIPALLLHILTQSMTGISIPTGCEIGKGLYIGHFSGIFLHDEVVLGEGCNLSQGVTIGVGGKGDRFGVPKVGKRVYFGPGSKIFGKITIGDDVHIGANAVVLDSIPAKATAVGIPAKVVRKKESSN